MEILKRVNAPEAEVTDQKIYWNRRLFLAAGAAVASSGLALAWAQSGGTAMPAREVRFKDLPKSAYSVSETPTDKKLVTSYVNYYEFGTDKRSPVGLSQKLKTSPWTVEVGGLVNRPQTFGIEDLTRLFPPEERIYRLRCVEAWSMVIPWLGFPLAELLKAVEPTGSAKYVRFVTLYDPDQMPGLDMPGYPWPYQEGLRLDEALHPLTILSTGLYGEPLLPQNGAPLRLVVPWKYGFKSIKSIVKIELVEKEPETLWSTIAPREYGFYANVNPQVSHPRWSQASERRIGELSRRPTLMFNGYAEDVAELYAGMDLSVDY